MAETLHNLKEKFEIELRNKYHLKCKKREVDEALEKLEATHQPYLQALSVAEKNSD